ncbi:MAG: phytochelatin synthase family protein [Cyanobium sp.]
MATLRRFRGPLIWGILTALSFAATPGRATPLPTTAGPLIPLEDPAGQALLMEASAREDHGPLAQWFETQANLAYCGVASAVMVLNSLAVPAPAVPGYGTYRFWTQANAFSIPGSGGFVRPEVVGKEGMTLAQLQGWLAQRPDLVVERNHGDRLSLAQWRALLARSLADPQDRLLVNYQRSALGQPGGGHISPVGAYDRSTDRVLILDVARYRYPAVWVRAEDLWGAMRTPDSSSGRSRGLLLIRRVATHLPLPAGGSGPQAR